MLDKLKKALGFGTPDEADELIVDDPETSKPNNSPFGDNSAGYEPQPNVDVDTVAKEIFAHVVEQFNASLPEFLKKSVDPEREKAALYESLSADIKSHLSRLENNVSSHLNESWRTEREKLQNELKSVSKTAKDIEAKRAELKAQQLSADRQKRAMTERIHELEKRNLALEAEKEQLDLEIKSMVNKVKVAQVYEKEVETLREEIEAARAGQTTPRETELKDKVTELEKTNNELKERNSQLSGIEKKYTSLLDKMKQLEEQLPQIDELNAAKDMRINELKKQLEAEKAKVAEAENKLAEALSHLEKKTAEAHNEITVSAETEADNEPVQFNDVDDILNDTDWIVQTPPKKENKRADRNKNKKANHRDDGQMSLW